MKLSKLKTGIIKTAIIMSILSGTLVISDASDNTTYFQGTDRVDTSIKTSSVMHSDKLVLASAYSFADSLSAYNIASKMNAKLILVGNNSDLRNIMRESRTKKVYIVGGKNSVNGLVVKYAEDYIGARNVSRIAGNDRYQTNEKTLAEAGYTKVGVADGRNFPDALASSGLLKKEGLGLKLVNGSKPYREKRTVVYTFGGVNSVKQNGGTRLAGSNRYETNRVINNRIGGTSVVAATTGKNYADALSAINVIDAKRNATILLVDRFNDYQKNLFKKASERYVIGGMVSKYDVDSIFNGGQTPAQSTQQAGGQAVNQYAQQTGNQTDSNAKVLDNGGIVSDGNAVAGTDNETGSSVSTNTSNTQQNTSETTKEQTGAVTDKKTEKVYSQKELDKLLLDKIEHGFDEVPLVVNVQNGVDVTTSINNLFQGMGFDFSVNRKENNGVKVLEITPEFAYKSLNMQYDKSEYLANLNFVKGLIEKSGANSKTTDYEKGRTFGLFIKYEFLYDYDNYLKLKKTDNWDEDITRHGNSPYSLYKYNKAFCGGFDFVFNQAMFLMKIPSGLVTGKIDIGKFEHANVMFYADGRYHEMNVTGIQERFDTKENTMQYLEAGLENKYQMIAEKCDGAVREETLPDTDIYR